MTVAQLRAVTATLPASTRVYAVLPDGTIVRPVRWRVVYGPVESEKVERWPAGLVIEGRVTEQPTTEQPV